MKGFTVKLLRLSSLIVFLNCVTVSRIVAQKSSELSLDFCGGHFALGMSKGDALGAVAASDMCQARVAGPVENGEVTYLVVSHIDGDISREYDTSYKVWGSFSVKDQSVVTVNKFYTLDIKDKLGFGQILIDLLRKFQVEGESDCKIKSPDSQNASLICGVRSLNLVHQKQSSAEWIQVDEQIQSRG